MAVLALVFALGPMHLTDAYEIRDATAKRCLMVIGEEWDGAPVRLSVCDGGPAQQWFYANNKIHKGKGLCLSVSNENQLRALTCNGDNSQRWIYTEKGELRYAVDDDRCLEIVLGGANSEKVSFQLSTCNESLTSRWVSSWPDSHE